MTTETLHDGGSGEKDNAEAKWQKHVMVALWVILALVVALTVVLIHAESHGFFQSSRIHPEAVAPWPDGLP